MLVRMQSSKNSHSLVAGIQNGSHFGRQFGGLGVSYKTKHTQTTCWSNWAFLYLHKGAENLMSYKTTQGCVQQF